MVRTISRFLFVLTCMATASTSQAQEPYQLVPQATYIEYQIGWDHRGQRQVLEQYTGFGELYPYQQWLGLEKVRDELKLSATQIADLDRLMEQRVDAYRRMFREVTEEDRAEVMMEQSLESFARLSDLLGPEKGQRLTEIRRRLLLRTIGIARFLHLQHEPWQLELSASQWQELNECLNQFAKQQMPTLKQSIQEDVDQLYRPLNSKQRRLLEQYRKRQPDSEVIPDLLIAQLRHTLKIAKDYQELQDEPLQQLAYFAAAPAFRIVWTGECEASMYPSDYFWSAEFGNFIVQATIDQLPIPEEDLDSLKSDYGKFQQRQALEELKWQKQIEQANEQSRELARKLQWERVEAVVAAHKQFTKDFFNHMSPPGQQAFLDYYHHRSALNYGMVAFLLYGPLGKELEMTEVQRQKILDDIPLVLKKIQQRYQDAEEDLFRQVYQIVGKDNEKILREKLGKPLHQISPNFTTLLQGLSTENSGAEAAPAAFSPTDVGN